MTGRSRKTGRISQKTEHPFRSNLDPQTRFLRSGAVFLGKNAFFCEKVLQSAVAGPIFAGRLSVRRHAPPSSF